MTRSALMINITESQHSSKWGNEQLLAAEDFGDIIDMQFPKVSQDANGTDLDILACDVVDKIMSRHVKYGGDYDTLAANVMGEPTLAFRIVALLKEEGVQCVCAIASKSTGQFRQFRTY